MSADDRGSFPRRIFVYGTLLAGEGNHELLRAARLVGPARTDAAWTMVSLGPFPALVAGGETSILGEVYEVDEPTLAALDRLEDHPAYYRRTPLRLDDHGDVEAYLLTAAQVAGCPVIVSGCWRTHRRQSER